MSSRVDQKQPKEQDIVVMQLETVKQHDAGFDQDRYMDGINYIDKRR